MKKTIFTVHTPLSIHSSANRFFAQLRQSRFFYFLILFAVLPVYTYTVFSCTGKNPPDMNEQRKSSKKRELTHSILFVVGKDFYRYTDLLLYLYRIYEPESLDAKIRLLTYGDMTAQTKQPRLTMITERLDAQPPDVMISLGMPEGGGKILRTVKEKYPALHVFSLLPVEEILPLEAYSTAVIDFELPDSFAKADRAVSIPVHDLQTLLFSATAAAEQIDEIPEQEPLQRFSQAFAIAAAQLEEHGITPWGGASYMLHPYKDPELNIRSYNYLILSQNSETGAAQPEKNRE